MKHLRDIEKEPTDYNEGDRVQLQHRYYAEGYEPQRYTYYEGVVTQVGTSSFNTAYDWYIIKLDNGEVIESWWMTAYKIIKKLESVEPNGLPSQEA